MTRIELLKYLTKEIKEFRKHPNLITINEHLTGINEDNMPTASQIDGILVAFVNRIGVSQCIDYALSVEDLDKEDA